MPRAIPSVRITVSVNRDTLIEFTKYFDYEHDNKRTKFEARVRMQAWQLIELGGMRRLERMMDDILYDVCGINSDEFDRTPMGFRTIEGEVTKFGTYKIHDVLSGHLYPAKDRWGSLRYMWRR